MKNSIGIFLKRNKMKIQDKVNMIDEKVSPKIGKKLFTSMKIMSNLWVMLIFPIFILVLGASLNSTTIKTFDMKKMSIEKTFISNDLYVPAGTTIELGTVIIQNGKKLPTENLFNLNEIGTSSSTSLFDIEITGHFNIEDVSGKEVIVDGVNGSEVSIYSSPDTKGIGVDFSKYKIFVENKYSETYNLNIESTSLTQIMRLSNNDNAILSIVNIDKSWLKMDIKLWVVLLIIFIWFLTLLILFSFKYYFSKWKSFTKIKCEVEDE